MSTPQTRAHLSVLEGGKLTIRTHLKSEVQLDRKRRVTPEMEAQMLAYKKRGWRLREISVKMQLPLATVGYHINGRRSK